jgi:hypothetical protein
MKQRVPLVARHPISSAVVLCAMAAITGVFLFARPQYHPANQGGLVKIDLTKYPAPAEGWQWTDGQPGFRFGEEEDKWNISQVRPAELAPARAAAGRWGVSPGSVRLLDAIRLAPGDLSMIVAGTDAADHTCIGFVRPSQAPSFSCPGHLGPQSAFVLVTTRGPFEADGRTVHPTFLTGVARGDVTRIVVDQPPEWANAGVYDREQGSLWGTFELSLGDSRRILVSVFREGGAVTRVPIEVTEPGDQLIQIPG